MTPKQKANDLIDKFFSKALPDAVECDLNVGKKCALIAVDSILEHMMGNRAYDFKEKLFWREVKAELQSFQNPYIVKS